MQSPYYRQNTMPLTANLGEKATPIHYLSDKPLLGRRKSKPSYADSGTFSQYQPETRPLNKRHLNADSETGCGHACEFINSLEVYGN